MTTLTPEQRDRLAAMDGPHTYHPDVPFYDWTVLTATDADGVRYWFHVPSVALLSPDTGEPCTCVLVPAAMGCPVHGLAATEPEQGA